MDMTVQFDLLAPITVKVEPEMIATDRDHSLEELKALQAKGHKIVVSFGGGVDSTAMLILLWINGIRPDLITFADTLAEKSATYSHIRSMDLWLARVGFPPVTWVQTLTEPETPYEGLEGKLLHGESMPSPAFGFQTHSCSVWAKVECQNNYLYGVNGKANKYSQHPIWVSHEETGLKVIRLIGYDAGEADSRRSANAYEAGAVVEPHWEKGAPASMKRAIAKWNKVKAAGKAARAANRDPITGKLKPKAQRIDVQKLGKKPSTRATYTTKAGAVKEKDFWNTGDSKKQREIKEGIDCRYPLQSVGWDRERSVKEIRKAGIKVPPKSSCTFCPAMQPWELWELAGTEKDLFLRALAMEHNALLGKHSRWDHDDCDYGSDWLAMVESKDKRWPNDQQAGLNPAFAWNRWARENGIVEWKGGAFIADQAHCLEMAEELRGKGGNAADGRTC